MFNQDRYISVLVGTGGAVCAVKLNYFHKYSAFISAGQKFAFLLDIESVYPLEGELSSSHRLLERVCINYPKAFEADAGGGLYLNGATCKLLQSHHKYTIAMNLANGR